MRLRNVKNKQEIMDASNYLIINPEKYKGTWNKVFKNNNPIYIEIGTGKGNFIIENSLRYKNINFIGIEKYDSIVSRCLLKIPEGIENLKIIRMNALSVDEVFDHEIDLIYLNFSDPWPKKRWHKRRLTSEVFLKKYDNIFKNVKKIVQKTDNQELFEYSIESLSSYGYTISSVSLDLHKLKENDNIMTEYEEKFTKKGLPIYRLIASKDDVKS